MKRAIIFLSTQLEDAVEEWLWIKEALSVSCQPPHESVRKLEALFEDLDEQAFNKELHAFCWDLPGDVDDIKFEEVHQEAWQETWRDHFEPLRIGSFDLVGEWQEWEDDPKTIRIYPGQAFGTGQHETTQLVIERMEAMDLQGKSVLDIGCGTGILSIVAERLGARSVLGFDVDPDCKENMTKHLAMNNTSKVTLKIGTFDQMELGRYDLVLANITINVLKEIWPKLAPHLAPAGRILNSGILGSQEDVTRKQLTKAGFQVVRVIPKNDWLLVEAERANLKRILMDDLGEIGDLVEPSEEERRHLVNVRRLHRDERVELLDGRGGMAIAKTVEVGKRKLVLEVLEIPKQDRESKPNLVLGLAIPTQLSTFDTMLPGLVQLGVQEIYLAPTAWSGRLKKDTEKYFSRLDNIMLQALKQCGRLLPPKLKLCSSWEDLCKTMVRRCDTTILYHPGGAVAPPLDPKLESLGLLFGAEAGFTDEEVALGKKRGFLIQDLGPRILKMETAVTGACFWARQTFQ